MEALAQRKMLKETCAIDDTDEEGKLFEHFVLYLFCWIN